MPHYPRNNNKTDYFLHSQVRVPKDLQVGDIIECTMVDDVPGKSLKRKLQPTQVVVLGFLMRFDTVSYKGLHVARFTHNLNHSSEDTAVFISKDDERTGNISGITLPVALKTDRTDAIPLNRKHFPSLLIERIGWVSPLLLTKFANALQDVQAKGLSTNSPYEAFKPDQLYIPSFLQILDPSLSLGGNWPEIGGPFSQFNDYDRALIARGLDNHFREVDGDEIHNSLMEDLWERRRSSRPKKRKGPTRFFPTASPAASIRSTFLSSADDSTPSNTERETKPTISPLDRQIVTIARSQAPSLDALVSHFQDRADLVQISLPKDLWRGRYLHLKISKLRNEQNDKEAYRPCIVWKVFHDKDTGKIAGMELYPVARSYEVYTPHRMKVHPMETLSKFPSVLLADHLVRVPIDTRYFHENFVGNFFELLPDRVKEFSNILDYVREANSPVSIYGLQEVPENWVEVDIPDTPSFEQFDDWYDKRLSRYDGNLFKGLRESSANRHAPKIRHPYQLLSRLG